MRPFIIPIAAVLLAGCATTPEGNPDCSQANNQRITIASSRIAAETAYSTALELCKDGEAGDKCRNIAATARTIAVNGLDLALVILNSRCPPP